MTDSKPIGLTKEEIEKKAMIPYDTHYEKAHKITTTNIKKVIDEPMFMAWKREKSDNTCTFIFTLKLGLYLEMWTPLIILTNSQVKPLETILKEYHETNKENEAKRGFIRADKLYDEDTKDST